MYSEEAEPFETKPQGNHALVLGLQYRPCLHDILVRVENAEDGYKEMANAMKTLRRDGIDAVKIWRQLSHDVVEELMASLDYDELRGVDIVDAEDCIIQRTRGEIESALCCEQEDVLARELVPKTVREHYGDHALIFALKRFGPVFRNQSNYKLLSSRVPFDEKNGVIEALKKLNYQIPLTVFDDNEDVLEELGRQLGTVRTGADYRAVRREFMEQVRSLQERTR